MTNGTVFVPWRGERHLQIELSTDASLFRWGAVVEPSSETLGDFFPQGDKRPIHLKEADALFKTLSILERRLKNHRVDARVDNKAHRVQRLRLSKGAKRLI